MNKDFRFYKLQTGPAVTAFPPTLLGVCDDRDGACGAAVVDETEFQVAETWF